jgi:hypothetical protein
MSESKTLQVLKDVKFNATVAFLREHKYVSQRETATAAYLLLDSLHKKNSALSTGEVSSLLLSRKKYVFAHTSKIYCLGGAISCSSLGYYLMQLLTPTFLCSIAGYLLGYFFFECWFPRSKTWRLWNDSLNSDMEVNLQEKRVVLSIFALNRFLNQDIY